MRTVEAVRDYGFVPGKGGSRPHRMLCNDQSEYWVKFPEHGSRALFNEGLGAEICLRFQLPSSDAVIVHLSEGFIRDSATLTQRGIHPGEYFGSKQVPAAFDFTEPAAAGIRPWDLANRNEIAKILGYDNWVRNMDRGGGANLLLTKVETPEGPRFRVIMIDNGLILTGAGWNSASLAAATGLMDIVPRFDFLNRCIWSTQEFWPFCDQIEATPSTIASELVAAVPPTWLSGEEDRTSASAFLEARKGLVRRILQSFVLNPQMPPP